LDLAVQGVDQALDRVQAAWQAEHPDLPWPGPEPGPSDWHPDPNQAPATTRQWAEQAKQVHQATQGLHASLQPPPVEGDPTSFTRVGPGILLSTARPAPNGRPPS